jgi:hypothetical protein
VLGFFSFTEVTDPAAHRAYNEWHQLDHLPEQFSLEGVRFGQRWVCTPRCATARVAVSPLLARCHYMTLYLLADADVVPQFFALGERLAAEDRFFQARKAHLAGPFALGDRRAAPRVKVSAGVVPFRPGRGVYAVVGPPVDGAAMVAHGGVAGVWQFVDAAAGRHIALAFIDGDLFESAAALGQWCLQGEARPEWAGPLETVDPFRWDWFAKLPPQ